MKRVSIILAVTLFFVLFGICFYKINRTIQLDTLYSESVLDKIDVNGKDRKQRFTRSQALKKAKVLFRDGYGIDLMNKNLEKYMNLYYDEEKYHSYVWLMNWTNYGTNETYTCTVSAETGEVLYYYVGVKNTKLNAGEKKFSLSYKTVVDIIEHFADLIDIDLSKYNLEVNYPVNDTEYKFWYQKCTLSNKETDEEEYMLSIDCGAKSIREFEKSAKKGK
ncbi:hypothetical protein lbkm_1021 [Lachnospiraceae bacterium KM106-2]|nr:hypothetical protein lbkm_1021 [Lachnospiraceae bacterium KM106-2]